MVNVNEAVPIFSINGFEIKTADKTINAVVFYTCSASFAVTFKNINGNTFRRAFIICLSTNDLFWKRSFVQYFLQRWEKCIKFSRRRLFEFSHVAQRLLIQIIRTFELQGLTTLAAY